MENQKWIEVDAETLAATSKEWIALLDKQEQVSPDKYLSTLSYLSDIIENKIQRLSTDKHYCFGYVNEKNQAKSVIHVVHAKANATDGGWLKVLSTRLSPILDPQLDKNENLDNQEYAQLLDDISTLASESLNYCIEFAIRKGLAKVKYYASNQVDFSLLHNLVVDINRSKTAKKLGIIADKKGQWIEVDL